MDHPRTPKQVLFGELSEGGWSVERPKLRFKDQCKKFLVELSIGVGKWEEIVKDRRTMKICKIKGLNI